ncbi:MAG: porin [Methylococcaceae bacterium]|nr:porin [Methylococcaceae bacterium]
MKPTKLSENKKDLKKINALLILALSGNIAHASADKELLDILLKNGSISKAQYGSLSGKEGLASNELLDVLVKNGTITKDQFSNLSKKTPAKPSTAVASSEHGAPKAEEKDAGRIKLSDKGLEFESTDGNFKTKIGGRLQVDSQANFNDPNGKYGTDLANGVNLRRARLYTEGTFFKDYGYKFEYDFTRNGGGTGGITDAFITYTGLRPFNLSIGQLAEGKSMESVMSNNYLTFIERSLPNNAFFEAGSSSKYQLGIIGDVADKVYGMPYMLRGGLTTESLGAPAPGTSSFNTQGSNNNNNNRNGFSGNTSYQLVGRTTLLPYKDKDGNLLHTGVWGSWRSINNNFNADGSLRTGGWQFQAQPNSNVDRTSWINTGNLTNTFICDLKNAKGTCIHSSPAHVASEVAMFGAELGGVWGPAHFTAEYMQARISGKGYSDPEVLEGFYAYAGYFLTGENRPYDEKKGAWGRVTPKRSFIGGSGWGALEVAARYDLMDMNTLHINGGSMNTGTLALNWYLTSRVRLMTDWVHVFNNNNSLACPATAGTPAAGTAIASASLGCLKGLSPDIWETAVRVDF